MKFEEAKGKEIRWDINTLIDNAKDMLGEVGKYFDEDIDEGINEIGEKNGGIEDIRKIGDRLIPEINSMVGKISVGHEKKTDDKIKYLCDKEERFSYIEKKIQEDSLTRCPYCGAVLSAEEISKNISTIRNEIESLKTEGEEIGRKKRDLKAVGLEIRRALDSEVRANLP